MVEAAVEEEHIKTRNRVNRFLTHFEWWRKFLQVVEERLWCSRVRGTAGEVQLSVL